ncbi:MAG: hypothetical protein R3B70_25500 [Polyangiaceae bacterium]
MSRAPHHRIAAAVALLASLALLNAAGCHFGRDPEVQPPPPPCQPGSCPPGQWPTLPPPAPDPSPTAAPPGLMPSFVGFPCHASEDLICLWGKCITGRCGGCQTDADCKPGGACGWTPIGMACQYGGARVPPR